MLAHHLGSFITSKISGWNTLYATYRPRPLKMALWWTSHWKSNTLSNKTSRGRLQRGIPKRTKERCRRRDVRSWQTRNASPRRLNGINNWTPPFHINGPIQVNENDQPITTTGPHQTAFAIDEHLQPTVDDQPQLGLNKKEVEKENEQRPVEPISQEEFIREEAENPECDEYGQTISLPTSYFNFYQSGYLIRMSTLDGELKMSFPDHYVTELSNYRTSRSQLDTRWIMTSLEDGCQILLTFHGKRSSTPCETLSRMYSDLTGNTSCVYFHQEDLYRISTLTYSDHFRRRRTIPRTSWL